MSNDNVVYNVDFGRGNIFPIIDHDLHSGYTAEDIKRHRLAGEVADMLIACDELSPGEAVARAIASRAITNSGD